MSRLRALFVSGLCVLGGCFVSSPDTQGAPIDVSYTPSFKTGCFVVRVADEANAANFVEERFSSEKRTSPLGLRALRKANWGTVVKVTVAARERDCEGKEVDRAELSVDLSNEGRQPLRTLALVTPDEDGDGYVARGDVKGGTDCDDSGPNAAAKFPGNREACDSEDNNCDGVVDEAFPTKNTPCGNATCVGVWVCDAEKSAVVCSAKPPRRFYVDQDQDGDGDANGAVVEVCAGETPPPGLVEGAHGDCDDADPSARSSGMEVCDAIDNNCNGVVDDGLSCGGSLKVVSDHHVISAHQDWKTVAMGANGYPVWIAGRGGKLAVRKAAGQKFESFSFGDPTSPLPQDGSPPLNSNHCGNHHWTVAWVDSAGTVFLGGEEGWLASHTGQSGFTCLAGTTPNWGTITGMVGFEPGGQRLIYLTDNTGRVIRWVPGGNPVFTELYKSSLIFHGLHAFNVELLHAVGGVNDVGGGQQFRAYEVPPDGPASPVFPTMVPDKVPGYVRAVWQGFATKACAVGDGGAVWRWNGTTRWEKAAVPTGGTVDFSSVVMTYDRENALNPLNEQCFMVDRGARGRLWRSTLYGWAKGPDLPAASADVPLNDIAMTPSGKELWVVGDSGRVFHYPER